MYDTIEHNKFESDGLAKAELGRTLIFPQLVENVQ